MKYLLKQMIVPFAYLIFTAIVAFGIINITDKLIWVKVILGILNFAIYACIVGAVCKDEGEKALKVRLRNDAERVQIIKTGEDIPLNISQEYKAWKGFAVGLITCAPLVILLIIHAILSAINPDLLGAGAIANFIYLTFGIFIRFDSTANLTYIHFYFNLIAVPILPLITGIPYMLGARKIQKQHDMIMERKRQIYGDDYDK